jgi:hypothetical protein
MIFMELTCKSYIQFSSLVCSLVFLCFWQVASPRLAREDSNFLDFWFRAEQTCDQKPWLSWSLEGVIAGHGLEYLLHL